VYITLTDGSSFFVPRDLLDSLNLTEGAECTEDDAERLRHAHLLHLAREKAVELLARSEHSRFLLARKLLLRDFPEGVVSDCLDELEQRGYLDDRRFAEQWVSSRIRRRPEGYLAIIAGLQQRGVDGGLAREVVDAFEHANGEEFERALERAGGRILAREGVSAEELREKLSRRGFRASEISSYIERVSERLSGRANREK
jgi:regulatory protein